MFRKHRSREKDPDVQLIKRYLMQMPDFDVTADEPYKRVKVNPQRLNEIFFDRNDEPNFTISELRKLDLSKVDFTGRNVRGYNYSYTNVNIDPQTVLSKNIANTNLEGVDMSTKDFTGVDIYGAKLINTGATIDLNTIKGEIYDLKDLEGCHVIENETVKKGRTR